ncbi:glycosyltransferase family 4 protein [Chthonobacter rhizosphaerae]|uniref:glycosyltransferase family 4 protein n=1 Tax=Chthonobacter rhizosphaerae TaxID=2735553 RepID=UPI0015EEC1D8|nr:glycosyltransferase family 4 protein [Chthonobacter rhizosphaerae]
MRIAQIAPLAEGVPPRRYGGTERVVSWLTEELVERGHEVTLFASGDSETAAELVACVPWGLRLAGIRDPTASHLAMLEDVRRREAEFDVIHFHIDLLQFSVFRSSSQARLTTAHGRMDLPDSAPVYRTFPEMPLVSISNNQRVFAPLGTNWVDTIYHGLPTSAAPFIARGGDYLAFLGRIAPEKRPDRAIEIATRAGIPLKIAAKIDSADQAYFREVIQPLLDNPLVEFVGEIGDHEKGEFLGNALALLFPIDWPEPFGLVMIEAMAAGTPVIAWRAGSVPEIVDICVTGLIVDSLAGAVEAVEQAIALPRARVRQQFDKRFTAGRMADDYVRLYDRLLGGAETSLRFPQVQPPHFPETALRVGK